MRASRSCIQISCRKARTLVFSAPPRANFPPKKKRCQSRAKWKWPIPSQVASNHQHVLIFVLNGAKPIIEIPQLAFATHFGHISRVNKNVLTSPGAEDTPVHWKQHLVSKWLVIPIYKPFRQFGRGTTLLRERVCLKKQLLHLETFGFFISK